MSCNVVLGGQWGDEGKAKVVDFFSSNVDYVVRYQGGDNAGHTIFYEGKKLIFHLLPSGLLHPSAIGVIGNGVVFNPTAFFDELKALKELNINVQDRVKISSQCQLIMPYHYLLDRGQEEKRDANRIGTTGKGIGPCYSDKVGRYGFRLIDLYSSSFKERLAFVLDRQNFLLSHYYKQDTLSLNSIYDEYQNIAESLEPYITNVPLLLNRALDNGAHLLCEGAQGTMLDVDFGVYPYVTSSNTTSGAVSTGTGIAPNRIDSVYGVFKSYLTRIGAGHFPTDMSKEEIGYLLATHGDEFGSTTGRPRRCGWFDAVLARYSIMINGIQSVFLTKLDVFDSIDEIKVCVAHRFNGVDVNDLDLMHMDWTQIEPVYRVFKGWKKPISHVKRYQELPEEAKYFITQLESMLNSPIRYISVGPKREQTIFKPA